MPKAQLYLEEFSGILSAPDSATGTYPGETHAPGTYSTIWTGPAFTATQLSVAGRYYIAPLPPTFSVTDTTNPTLIATVAPRFYKLQWTASSTITSMTMLAGLVIDPADSLRAPTQYNLNYAVV